MTSVLERRSSVEMTLLVEEAPSAAPLSLRKLMRYFGPGLLMAIAYVDPGNLESDLQTGATTGYALLWLLGATTLMGFTVQMQAARLGVVTGKNLAELCKAHYPRGASLLLWVMAEVAIIGSDIQEVIGSAIALSILSQGALRLWQAALVSAATSFLLLLVERAGIRQLEAIFACFILVMVTAFGYMFAAADVPLKEVAQGFLWPELPRAALPTAVALFGSLIMPHNIYLHSALVQSRGLSDATPAVKKDALKYFGIESGLSLLAALVINTCVVCVFAAGFHSTGADIPDIGLQNAGEFLGSQYGMVMAVVWGLGLLAAGQSSTMTGTYTGQFVMSGFLDLKVSAWARIFITRSVALVPTMAVALTMDDQSTGLDKLNQGLNLLQSIQLPFALIPMLTFTGSTALMGCLATRGVLLWAAWGVALIVICVNMTAVAEVAGAWAEQGGHGFDAWVLPVCLAAAGILYFSFLLFLMSSAPDGCLPGVTGWGRRRRAHHHEHEQGQGHLICPPSGCPTTNGHEQRQPLLANGHGPPGLAGEHVEEEEDGTVINVVMTATGPRLNGEAPHRQQQQQANGRHH